MRREAVEPIAFEQLLLRQFSPSFRALYDYCLNRIDLKVRWFYQPPGERRSEVVLEPSPGEAYICLSRELPTHIQEIHAAEELWHVLQYCEGFCIVEPQRRCIREWKEVAKALSSLLCDPLAYEAMVPFGLDLEPFFSEMANEKHAGLEDIRLMMRDFEAGDLRMYWGALLNFASSILELPSPLLEEVEAFCCPEFPGLWQAAKDLVAAIHRHGFGTPERQCTLLRSILKENQLTQYLAVVQKSSAQQT